MLAVVLGYGVFAASGGLLFKVAGRDPHAVQDFWFVVLAVIYGMVFAGLGGGVGEFADADVPEPGLELYRAELLCSQPIRWVRKAISRRVLVRSDQKFQRELSEDRSGPKFRVGTS